MLVRIDVCMFVSAKVSVKVAYLYLGGHSLTETEAHQFD